jgi:hypothetical protein
LPVLECGTEPSTGITKGDKIQKFVTKWSESIIATNKKVVKLRVQWYG